MYRNVITSLCDNEKILSIYYDIWCVCSVSSDNPAPINSPVQHIHATHTRPALLSLVNCPSIHHSIIFLHSDLVENILRILNCPSMSPYRYTPHYGLVFTALVSLVHWTVNFSSLRFHSKNCENIKLSWNYHERIEPQTLNCLSNWNMSWLLIVSSLFCHTVLWYCVQVKMVASTPLFSILSLYSIEELFDYCLKILTNHPPPNSGELVNSDLNQYSRESCMNF